jgi:hypothetical protein
MSLLTNLQMMFSAVSKPPQQVWIWDVPMSARSGVFALRLKTTLPDQKTVTTGMACGQKTNLLPAWSASSNKPGL